MRLSLQLVYFTCNVILACSAHSNIFIILDCMSKVQKHMYHIIWNSSSKVWITLGWCSGNALKWSKIWWGGVRINTSTCTWSNENMRKFIFNFPWPIDWLKWKDYKFSNAAAINSRSCLIMCENEIYVLIGEIYYF